MQFKLLIFYMLASSSPIYAQMKYHDVNPDSTIEANTTLMKASYYVDFDRDGIYEKEIRHFNPGPGNEAVELANNPNLSFMAQQALTPDSRNLKLKKGDNIGAALTWGYAMGGKLDASWHDGTDKYIGMKFDIGGSMHYGWIRIIAAPDRKSFTIKDFAYNPVADESITAGHGWATSIAESSGIFKARLLADANYISFIGLAGHGIYQLNVYDAAGRCVIDTKIANGMPVNVAGLNAGLYIIALEDGPAKVTHKLVR